MSRGFTAKTVVEINAAASRVWGALTEPELIKQYFFGTNVTTNWQAGNPITYSGVWEGKEYEDKGTILQVEPERLLASTFWSALSGVPDTPENYQTIIYELTPGNDGKTTLTVTQDNNRTENDANQSEKNWNMVLDGMRKLLEETPKL